MATSDYLAGIWHQVSVTLTNAQVKALPTTSQTLVPAPGTTQMLMPVSGVLVQTIVSNGAYTNIDNYTHMALVYVGSNVVGLNGPFTPDLFGLTSSTMAGLAQTQYPDGNSPPIALFVTGTTLADYVNKSMVLTVANDLGNFTGGHADNTLDITVVYLIYDTVSKQFV